MERIEKVPDGTYTYLRDVFDRQNSFYPVGFYGDNGVYVVIEREAVCELFGSCWI